MNTWSVDQVPPQAGKVAIVTGANSGLGYETTLALIKKGFEVVMACRDPHKAEAAKAELLRSYPAGKLQTMRVDMSVLADVRTFAAEFKSRHGRLDLLINNAGIMLAPHRVTADGFESQLATNYMGHFALTGLLLPLLTAGHASRIVTLTSISYKLAKIQFDDLHARKGYNKRTAYRQSKRACLVFALELQRRLHLAGHTTLSVAAHPGLCKTNLDRYFPALIRPLGSLFLQPAHRGALPILYAALEKDVKGGEFIGPDGFQEMRGEPTRLAADEDAQDQDVAQRLWKVSEEMTGVHYLSGGPA